MFNPKNVFDGEDSDLSLRVIRKYGKDRFLYRPNALVYHDTHRNFLKAMSWYIKRGRADIDLLFIDMVHLSYVLKTSILLKIASFLFLGFVFSLKVFFLLLILWYFYQIYKHIFMIKYFKIYSFKLIYRSVILLLFPLLKLSFDLSFDMGRCIQVYNFLKSRI